MAQGGMIIATARDAADLLVPFFASAKSKKVVAAHLDAERRLIETIEIVTNECDAIKIPMRAIFSDVFRLGASGLVIAHNHSDGDLAPSDTDLAVMREFATTAHILGIQLYDHLIVGGDGDCRSLRALGLF